ncbi:reverse transcriptase N-terminal domain-containing protein [Salmonella enterica subsp. enterica serovar Mbandaka]|nr:reverse transcriptase N-terminal domain-containing protein [Salmonella enterica subsp. enterica serovar Mbandaka]
MNTETRVESQAVSASSRPERWHAINWRKTSEAVRKLQVRIAKAALQQEWRRVKALQRMLTRSLAAKALAVRRVTENRGKDTPGVDGKLWSTPKTLQTPNEYGKCRVFIRNYRSEEFYARNYAHKGNS